MTVTSEIAQRAVEKVLRDLLLLSNDQNLWTAKTISGHWRNKGNNGKANASFVIAISLREIREPLFLVIEAKDMRRCERTPLLIGTAPWSPFETGGGSVIPEVLLFPVWED